MKETQLEKKDVVFLHCPTIQDICIEFDVTDPVTITCMYELFKKMMNYDMESKIYLEDYNDGYRDGYNDAISQSIREVDSLSWELEKSKKK